MEGVGLGEYVLFEFFTLSFVVVALKKVLAWINKGKVSGSVRGYAHTL